MDTALDIWECTAYSYLTRIAHSILKAGTQIKKHAGVYVCMLLFLSERIFQVKPVYASC